MTYLLADFNAIDEDGRVWLPEAEREAVYVGERVVLTDGDIGIAATLDYDQIRHVWIGEMERDSLRQANAEPELPLSSR